MGATALDPNKPFSGRPDSQLFSVIATMVLCMDPTLLEGKETVVELAGSGKWRPMKSRAQVAEFVDFTASQLADMIEASSALNELSMRNNVNFTGDIMRAPRMAEIPSYVPESKDLPERNYAALVDEMAYKPTFLDGIKQFVKRYMTVADDADREKTILQFCNRLDQLRNWLVAERGLGEFGPVA